MKNKKIIYQENKEIKTKYLDEFDNKNLPKNIIEIKEEFDFDFKLGLNKRVSLSDIKNILYELKLMLEANILLDEAFDILIKKQKNRQKKEFLEGLKESFSNSKDISKLFEKYKVNHLVKSFFIILQKSGNTKMNIASLYELIEESSQNKKEFLKAISYPIILLISFFFALIGIFNFVVPNFESIILNSNVNLSFSTKSLFMAKDFFENYLFFSFLFLLFLPLILFFTYKYSKKAKYFIHKIIAFHIPLFSSLYRYRVFYIYMTSIDILLKNKYELYESLTKARTLINNQTVLAKIMQLEDSIKNGKSVSSSFESSKLFDDMSINILSSAETSNSLEKAFCKLKEVYKIRFDNRVKFFILLMEPLFFIIIMGLIVWIIMALFIPLWSMGDLLKL